MARQNTSPVAFQRQPRVDTAVTRTSARAGDVRPIAYMPILREDSASGKVGIDLELAEMPRPLINGVHANIQAWFVPKSAMPQFSGYDEFMHSYQGQDIKALGSTDRTPPPFFTMLTAGDRSLIAASEFFKTLGIHVPTSANVSTDLVDAFNLVYNFRLAAHSSRLTRKDYCAENLSNALALPPAFWPSGRFSRVVPDYERALILGSLDLDVAAGQMPVAGITRQGVMNSTSSACWLDNEPTYQLIHQGTNGIKFDLPHGAATQIYADMAEQTIGTSLADIDYARKTQAFAKLRSSMAGNDATGFDNDDAIIAELMQGFSVPEDQFKRPWLLDSVRTSFGFVERHATDAANLDASVTKGVLSAQLSINLPRQNTGGVIIVTCEVLPDRIDERQTDEWLHISTVSELPDALRDVQRPEPVDMVLKRRLDAAHTAPDELYGYEPMNDVWNREFTRLGGEYYQANPLAPWTEQRSAIWQANIVNPTFSSDHWLCPSPFPHDVFSDTLADAYDVTVRHSISVSGLTQIGDVLAENNDDYVAITAE